MYLCTHHGMHCIANDAVAGDERRHWSLLSPTDWTVSHPTPQILMLEALNPSGTDLEIGPLKK